MPLGLLYTGNSLDILKELQSESVQMCVTSPPYWGLRDYTVCACRGGVDGNNNGQGASTLKVDGRPNGGYASEESRARSAALIKTKASEPDLNCVKCAGTGHINGLYQVWGGDADCEHSWIEMSVAGKSGGTSDKQLSNVGSRFPGSICSICSICSAWYGSLGNEPTPELFIEHLVMIFREVRRVLRADATLWVNIGDSYAASGGGAHKPEHKNPGISRSAVRSPAVQSSIKPKDLVGIPWMLAFALRADGWWLRQDIVWAKNNPMPESVTDRCVKSHEYMFLLSKSRDYCFDHIAIQEDAQEYAKGRRTVKLGKKSLSKGQSAGANVVESGNALLDEVGLKPKRNKRSVWTMSSAQFKGAHFATYPPALVDTPILAGSKSGDIVLDCFSGAATTGLVALQLGREYIGIEQNGDYNLLAEKRLKDAGLDCEIL